MPGRENSTQAVKLV